MRRGVEASRTPTSSYYGGLFMAAFGGGFRATPGIAAGFAMADDASRTKTATAIGGNPSSAESIDAGGAAGSRRRGRRTAATAGTGVAAILRAADIERSGSRLAGLMLRCGKQRIEAVVVVAENLICRTHGRKSSDARRDKNPKLLERSFRPAREFGGPATRRAC